MEDPAECVEAAFIIENVLRQKLPGNFHESLLSGVRLCMFFIALFPLSRRPKFRSGRPEHYESNVVSFLQAAATVLPPNRLFQVSDLLPGSREGLLRVAQTIKSLAKISGRSLPRQVLRAPTLAPPSVSSISSATGAMNAGLHTAIISDAQSVGSASSSSTDWCRVDFAMASPQQQTFSPMSTHDSWVRVPRFEGLGGSDSS